jgi:deoxyribonuclease-1
MHVEYGLDIWGMTPMLKRWHTADSPNQDERSRNSRIEKLQGVRNRFIDRPALVAGLK